VEQSIIKYKTNGKMNKVNVVGDFFNIFFFEIGLFRSYNIM